LGAPAARKEGSLKRIRMVHPPPGTS